MGPYPQTGAPCCPSRALDSGGLRQLVAETQGWLPPSELLVEEALVQGRPGLELGGWIVRPRHETPELQVERG